MPTSSTQRIAPFTPLTARDDTATPLAPSAAVVHAPAAPTVLPERNLDVLRSVAVLLVLFDHVHRLFAPTIGSFANEQFGSMGVHMFFVHTSLVLMASLERGGTKPGWLRSFYVRRAFRIFPLAAVAVLASVAFQLPPFLRSWAPVPAYDAPSMLELLANLSLTQNLVGARDLLAPLWSLPVEVQMYAVLPALFLAARRVDRLLVLCLVAAILVAWLTWSATVADAFQVPGLWRLRFLTYAPCFVSGVVAYRLLWQRHPDASRHGVLPARALGPVLALAALFFLVTPRPWNGWGMCLGLGVALPAFRDHANERLATLAKLVARYSYGIYLGHSFAIWIAFVTLRAQGLAAGWLAFATLVMLIPVAGYHLIEAPCIRLGQRLTSSRSRVSAGADEGRPAASAAGLV